jgi:hypothetical protein
VTGDSSGLPTGAGTAQRRILRWPASIAGAVRATRGQGRTSAGVAGAGGPGDTGDPTLWGVNAGDGCAFAPGLLGWPDCPPKGQRRTWLSVTVMSP